MNSDMAPGFAVRTRKNGSGEWEWEVVQFRRIAASGVCASEKEAAAALKTALGEQLMAAITTRYSKSVLRLKLRGLVERRPYVVMHVIGKALDGMKLAEVIALAGAEEIALHAADQARFGKEMISDLSTHANRKNPKEVAREVCDIIKGMGWKQGQLKKYAEDTFGPSFFTPGITVDDAIAMSIADAKDRADRRAR